MHIGMLGHVAQLSRFDISYATTRLAQFNCAPSEAAFQGIKRVYRYLATHPHVPIFYPRIRINGTQEMRYDYDPGNFHRMIISNNLGVWPDADHARDQKARRSMTCVLALLLGVIIHWKMERQNCVAAHTTDSEVRAFYVGTKINQYLRAIIEWMGIPLPEPTDMYEDNQACMDILAANQVTSRVKHIAVPIPYCHEQIRAMALR
jgi:hypothetical protein